VRRAECNGFKQYVETLWRRLHPRDGRQQHLREYQKQIERDPPFQRRVQPVDGRGGKASLDDAKQVLRCLKKVRAFHGRAYYDERSLAP